MALTSFVILFGVLAKVALGAPLLPASNHTPFIIGGQTAPEAYAPHMAALIFGERVQFIMCGGSIIARGLILTAAHCIEPFILDSGGLLESFHILVGSNKWNSGGIVATIRNYHMHPQWDSERIKYDAGVLVLENKLVLNEKVATIGLGIEFVEGNEKTFVTGWGRVGPRFEEDFVNLEPTPDELQLIYVNTISHEQCQAQMTSVAGHQAPHIQRQIEICTFHSYQHGMCHGDSGSALVLIDTNKQIGIVSWGYSCARGAPDIFTRLSGITDFLDYYMKMYTD